MGTKNFKSGGAYKKWLGYVYAKDLNKPGGDDVTIKGKKHKVDRSAAKQTTNMKTNQDGGDASTTEAADQLKKLGSPAKKRSRRKAKKDEEFKWIDSPAKKMDHYEDKEASMDDYSHEKKLGADGRYELEHGKKADAENDFAHAHALKKDAHYDHMNRKSFVTQFNDKSPMKRFQDFDQMDTWDAKATAGESPATQYRLGQKISTKGDTTSFEMIPDGQEWSEEDNAMMTTTKENIISNAEYNRRMNPSGGKGKKMSKVVKSITKQLKSPAQKCGPLSKHFKK